MKYLKNCDLCGSGDISYINKTKDIYKCRKCGYIFDNPSPDFNEIVNFYSKGDKYDSYLKEEKERDILWQKRLAMVKRYKKAGSILDVGAAIGQFLFFASRDFNIFGTEISESAIKIAKDKYNLNLLKGNLEDIDFGDQKFDLITLFHVLEHVPSPSSLIKKCYDLLNKDGIIVIAVPNDINSLTFLTHIRRPYELLYLILCLCRERDYNIQRLPKIKLDGSLKEIHLSHFTTSSLKRLLIKNKLKIIEDTLGINKYKDDLKFYFFLVLKIIFRINIYDCIWIAAKRQ